MRIFAIGLGGAGCRIADMLYGQDRQFSKVSCVEAIAIDRDAGTLNHLAHIPVEKRIYFPPVSLQTDDITDDITTDEIISLLHNLDTGDKDAIILCTGAGGTMAGIGVPILEKIRPTVVEPVFGLISLPATSEGKKTSAKAAKDIERLLPLVEGIILFDNEKTQGLYPEKEKKEAKSASHKGNPLDRPRIPDDPAARYKTANNSIARRLGLLLRAGEIGEGGEIETGEVVLDAGEILNTMRGAGFIAIGYAAADTTGRKFHIGSIFRPSGKPVESGHKKAERLVDLAKEAIYENISVPCDMTSADKALILVAGPSQEISMKGFMTVRKWVDRSIRGLEMRSGDYPVNNTRYIAIIIILAGLSNIPRLNEIKEIRVDYTKENPGWELEWENKAFQNSDHGKGKSESPDYPGGLTKTIIAGQENIQSFIRARIPDHGNKKSSSPGAPGKMKQGKSIPFFNRQKSSGHSGSVVVPVKTASSEENQVSGTTEDISNRKSVDASMPDKGATTQITPENSVIISDEIPVVIIQDPVIQGQDTPPHNVKESLVKPKSTKTDLASVVARAREDLKKMDDNH
jgi:tubulin-like protein CetZ